MDKDKRVLFAVAALFHAAKIHISGTDLPDPAVSFNEAEKFIAEADKRGVNLDAE